MTDSLASTITRTFAATPEQVFEAWVSPPTFSLWWGGTDVEVPLESLTLDARPDGHWEATMLLGDGTPDYRFYGEYVEVDRPNKLVFTMTDEPGDARELISVTLTALDGGTQLRFSQTGGNLTPEQYEAVTLAWQLNFDALETTLAA
ncbi:SRPBCC family protein [Subtercola endophyticus]|uniref:SRPBCC family protein n=1 Tax=Subtercola endophyticus TaxID=2895559 RepID=UPI001E2E021F|nr:SRPBCC domain-containing protein [Subtercola endophyticus]UFS60034.1 SRPBCC domain-containing protein [Subtercola endophyticus]